MVVLGLLLVGTLTVYLISSVRQTDWRFENKKKDSLSLVVNNILLVQKAIVQKKYIYNRCKRIQIRTYDIHVAMHISDMVFS